MKRRHFVQGTLFSAAVIGLPVYWFNRWDYLTIHHSAGASGDLDLLRRVHRRRQARDPVDEVPYHFLVGNGKGIAAGAVVPSERWRLQIWGAHVSARNRDRNFRSIGICLIGNFQNARPGAVQYDATVALCRDLMRRFNIASDRVTLHGETPGEATLCPGKNFPRDRFFEDIRQA
ncbi:peptidoglycan recognition family protein [Pelagibius sp.]|uniref:peptidoglycan recognition protein family protein n=1 Tax=Pelagibius sp. TaxID=1931238 RepID=UPI00261A116B|nr:peptidoglycan recognition family protein [Pelagibius sp.]